ncbi:hypothetical protein ACQRIT_002977 [Beauveria bassiana]
MPRGESATYRACERCRRKKRKCNGNASKPCKVCREGGVNCVYVENPRVSKADLRERLAHLQLINSENDTLLDFLSSKKTSPADLNSILRRLADGQPRAEVTSSLPAQTPIAQDDCSQKGVGAGSDHDEALSFTCADTSTVASSSVTEAPSTISPVATVLDSPSTSAGTSSNAPSLCVVLPAISTQESHFRANRECYRLQLPQLLDVILARDCLSFCPINGTYLKRDFGRGHGLYCSTALIDSLLALGTLLVKDNASLATRFGARGKLADDYLGQAFAREAISALYNGTGLPRRIADIQALGILSLYCLSCNKLDDSKGFAADFGAAIIEQWRTEQSKESNSLCFQDTQVHANIYCAAVSSNSETVKVYEQGLSWYASFFQYTNVCGDRHMPLILFVHTYHHFCILCIFTPYILQGAPIAIDGTLPETVCKQAASSIQELVKYYSQFCSNGKLLDFMPLFKSAALSLLEIGEAKTC